MTLGPLSSLSVLLLSVATGAWALGWCLDVGTTWRGIQRAGGDARIERNPLARGLFLLLGVRGGFAALLGIEGLVVSLHWLLATYPLPLRSHPAWSALCAASLVLGGLGHALAARANRTGHLPRALLPILRLYDILGRALPGRLWR